MWKEKIDEVGIGGTFVHWGVLFSVPSMAGAEEIDINAGDTPPIAGVDTTGRDMMSEPLWSLSGAETTLNILGGNWNNSFAAKYGDGADANGGILNIKGGTFSKTVSGGMSKTGNATGNVVNIYGGTFGTDGAEVLNIVGGWAAGSASDNTVNIYGVDEIYGGVYAAQSNGGPSSNNVVNIWNAINIKGYLGGIIRMCG